MMGCVNNGEGGCFLLSCGGVAANEDEPSPGAAAGSR